MLSVAKHLALIKDSSASPQNDTCHLSSNRTIVKIYSKSRKLTKIKKTFSKNLLQ
jgi:hypothetical protein